MTELFSNAADEVENVEVITQTKHLCWIYASDDDRLKIVEPYLVSALSRQRQCLLVLPEDATKSILNELVAADMNVDRYQETGQLVTVRPEALLLDAGRLDNDVAINRLLTAISDALEKGWQGAALVTDPSELLDRAGEDDWLALEFRADYECSTRPCTMLCLYDQRLISGSFLTNLIKVHPVIGLGDSLARNPFYVEQQGMTS